MDTINVVEKQPTKWEKYLQIIYMVFIGIYLFIGNC
jgi:hypothetical protein